MHTVHNSLYETGIAFLYLFWESKLIKKQVIPSAYFYTAVKEPIIVPMDYDSKMFRLDKVGENDPAFTDSED